MAELKRQASPKIDRLAQHHQGVDLLVRHRDIKGGRREETDRQQDVVLASQIPDRANGDGNEYSGGDVSHDKIAACYLEFGAIVAAQQGPGATLFDSRGDANPREADERPEGSVKYDPIRAQTR